MNINNDMYKLYHSLINNFSVITVLNAFAFFLQGFFQPHRCFVEVPMFQKIFKYQRSKKLILAFSKRFEFLFRPHQRVHFVNKFLMMVDFFL